MTAIANANTSGPSPGATTTSASEARVAPVVRPSARSGAVCSVLSAVPENARGTMTAAMELSTNSTVTPGRGSTAYRKQIPADSMLARETATIARLILKRAQMRPHVSAKHTSPRAAATASAMSSAVPKLPNQEKYANASAQHRYSMPPPAPSSMDGRRFPASDKPRNSAPNSVAANRVVSAKVPTNSNVCSKRRNEMTVPE